MDSGELSLLDGLPDGRQPIEMPTVAIWGEHDEASREESERTKSFFSPRRLWTYVHRGAHEVPGPTVSGSIQGTVRLINRAITTVRLEPQQESMSSM